MRGVYALLACAVLVGAGGCGDSEDPSPPPNAPPPVALTAANVQERWEFYPARIDDRPASVLLDLGFRPGAPLPDLPHLLWINLDMREPGPHGMGSTNTADQLTAHEELLTAHLAKRMGARLVARIRGKGIWQLRYYAPKPEGLEFEARAALREHPKQTFEVGTDHDPKWAYYLDFLCPEPERMRWINDRRLVDQLEKNGDLLSVARPVDHWLYFATEAARTQFEKSIDELGFRIVSRRTEEKGTPARPYGLNIARDDAVELETIHGLVMKLVKAAHAVDGEYDGWGCVSVKTLPEGGG